MKSVMGWIIVLVLIIAAAGLGLWQFNESSREKAYELELLTLQRNFQQKFVGLSQLPAGEYQKEVGIALTAYFSELAKLARKYPKLYDIDRERRHGEEELARGRMPEGHKLAREERIDIVQDLFERMRSGQYRPLYTAADKTFRFDVWDISPAKVNGEDRVKMAYAHWGAFGPVAYHSIIGNIRVEQNPEDRKEVPQFVADGQPPSMQIKPQRWVKEFPPHVEIGYYDLPQFPRRAEGVQLSFGFGIRTVGGTELPVHLDLPEIPIPESWKVPEGQEWKGQERLASDEELQEASGQAVAQ